MAVRDAPFGNFPAEKIAEVERLGRAGFSVREICRRVETNHHNVRPILAKLDVAGEIPANCPCGQDRRHRAGSCVLSVAPPRKPYPKIRLSRLPRAKILDLRNRVDRGEADRLIARETGISLTAVTQHRRYWISRRETPLPPCRCGRPARHPGGCIKNSPSLLTAFRIKRIEKWALEELSAAEMVRRSRRGTNIHTVLKYATPIWEAMASDGRFCGCGERRGHRAACSATWDSGGRVRGPQPIPVADQVRISNALFNGDSIVAIRQNTGLSEKKVLRVFRAMSAEERHRRAVLVKRRIGDDGGRAHGEDLFERIQQIIPAGLEVSVREEVVSELCLAVLDGQITIDGIKAHARRYIGKAFTAWANAFGPRSMDETLGDDGDRTLADIVGDDTFADQLGDISIGDGW